MPYVNRSPRSEYWAARAVKRRAAGLCANCNAKAIPGE